MRQAFDENEDDFDARRAGPPRRRRRLPWLRMALTSAALVTAMTRVAEERAATPREPVAGAAETPPAARWQAIADAAPAYAIEGVAAAASAVRREVEGGREDSLTVKSVGEPGYGHLRIRHGGVEAAPASFYVDLVRQAAAAGLAIRRSGRIERLETKFGPAETASLTLVGAGEQICQAVRLLPAGTAFSVQGWVCGGTAGPPVAGELACFLDRLTPVGAADPALRTLFAEAERRRSEGCGPLRRLAGLRGP